MKKPFYRQMVVAVCAVVALNATVPFLVYAEDVSTTATELTDVATAEQSEDELYAPIIAKVKANLESETGFNQRGASPLYGALLNNEDEFSVLWYLDKTLTTSSTGYAITDLDGDGREELVLGTISEDNNGTIFDIYTNYEGNVYHIAAAGERDHFALTNRGTIVEEGNNNASSYSIVFYNIGKNRLEVDSAYLVKDNKNYKVDSYVDNEDGTGYDFTWAESEEVPTIYAYQFIKFTPFSEFTAEKSTAESRYFW